MLAHFSHIGTTPFRTANRSNHVGCLIIRQRGGEIVHPDIQKSSRSGCGLASRFPCEAATHRKANAGAEAALLGRALECHDFAVALPKLYVVAVYELPNGIDSGIVVCATQVDRPDEVAVQTNDIRAIMLHL